MYVGFTGGQESRVVIFLGSINHVTATQTKSIHFNLTHAILNRQQNNQNDEVGPCSIDSCGKEWARSTMDTLFNHTHAWTSSKAENKM